MEMHNRNQPEMLPYERLAALGIDREKADLLPQEVKDRLVSGEVTPLMQVSISTRNGDVITLPLKLTMPKFTLHSICINTKKVYILNFVFLKKFTFPFGPF